MSLRDVQMEAGVCWCHNPIFLTDLEGVSSSLAAVSSSGCIVSQDGFLWYTVLFPKLSLDSVDEVVAELPTFLPRDVWQFGSREDHAVEQDIHRWVHSCVVVLLACGRPYTGRAIEAVMRKMLVDVTGRDDQAIVVSPCPAHASSRDLHFASVCDWVVSRVNFISAAARGTAANGLRRGVFGYMAIYRVLEFQFGTACRPLVVEMQLAKEMQDEEDGILPGGFAPGLLIGDEPSETIYVKVLP